MGARYPAAEWVPWYYNPAAPGFYKGENSPIAVVLHRAEGYEGTIRSWAASGYSYASWHFTVTDDGRVLQHLELEDGGYQAGLARTRASGRLNPDPTWPLWRGWNGGNINKYTVGIEHTGFSGNPFTSAQAAASKALCLWLALTLGFPVARDRFPAHAEIDALDRPLDFNTPELREPFYEYLLAAGPPAPFVPKPGDKPIPFNAEQKRVLQEQVFRNAYVAPRTTIVSGADLPIEAAYSLGGRNGVLPAGQPMAMYEVFVEVAEPGDSPIRPV